MELRRLLHATLLFLLLYVCGATDCFPPDRLALRQLAAFSLRQNLTGIPSYLNHINPTRATTAFVGWDGEECCSWPGVVCNSANHSAAARVSKLLLADKDLVGAFPEAICSLSALSTLNLSSNYLTGSIPSCFAHNLTNLRHLDLSLNFDLDSTTLPVSALPHLAYLDLSGNAFASIPPFQNPRLRWLLLSQIGFSESSIPVFTNGTPNLQHLDLSRNYFTSGISNLFTFPLLQLQHLDLSGCGSLSDEIPVTAMISQVPQLRTLLLNFTLLVAEGQQISELLCGLKSLEVLSVPGGYYDEYFASMKEVQRQPRNFGNLVGEMPQPDSCKSPSLNLTFLDVSNNKLRGPFPAWLSLFSNLQVLRLSDNKFSSSAIPPEWQNLRHLRVLQLSGPTSKPTQHMQISWPFRSPLEILTLSSLGLANQHIPCSQLSLLNATLHYLDFSNNLLTGAHALRCLAHSNFTTLEYLDLSQNALAFNLGLAIPPSLTNRLNLASCELQGELTDQFFGMLRSITVFSARRYNGAYLLFSMKDVEISLAQNSFSGNLPSGIGVLVGVVKLDLSYNNFTGRIPASLGNMSELWSLNLQNNHLVGEVPQELGSLYLGVLLLGNNKLTKWFPSTVSSPGILDLSYNRLEGDLEQTFFVQPMWDFPFVLLLGHNRLSGAIPHILFNGTTAAVLSIIQLSHNHLTGTIPHTLFKLFPSLVLNEYVSYTGGIVYDEIPFTLIVKNLELSYDPRSQIFAYLDLSHNKLNGSIPESLGQLSRLIYLNLSRNELTGNIPSSLSNLSLLESLDLSYNGLQGSLPPSLSKLTKLEVFNVSFNEELSGPIPANSPQLEGNTSYIGDLKLCGYPYLQRCSDTEASVVPHPKEDHEIEERESFLIQWIDEWIAIPGLCVGIVVGFLGTLWVLKFISFI